MVLLLGLSFTCPRRTRDYDSFVFWIGNYLQVILPASLPENMKDFMSLLSHSNPPCWSLLDSVLSF